MKKLVLFFLALFLASSGFGQWAVGPRLGVNFSTVSGKWSKDDDSKNGWIAGLTFGAIGQYEYTDMISFSGELIFITMGEKTTYDYSEDGKRSTQSEYNFSVSDRCHYILLPLLVRFSFGSNFRFFGFIGPTFSYHIGGHYKFKNGDDVTKGRYRYNEDKVKDDDIYLDPEQNRRFDLGMNIGGGVGKKIGPGTLEADLRFGMGFLDRNKFDSKEDKQDAKDNGYKGYKNIGICLNFSYMYPLGK